MEDRGLTLFVIGVIMLLCDGAYQLGHRNGIINMEKQCCRAKVGVYEYDLDNVSTFHFIYPKE